MKHSIGVALINVFVLLLCLPGCAGTALPGLGKLPSLKFNETLAADLNAAIEQADQATDPMAPQRAICYRTIASLIPEAPPATAAAPPIPRPRGVFAAFESSAELVEAADGVTGFSLSPEARVRLAIDCGPIQVRAKGILARFLTRFGRGL